VRLDQLVFIDEFGVASNMTRLYARGPKSRRVVCRTPQSHWQVLSTIAAMTTSGILAAGTFQEAVSEEVFVSFVQQCLLPQLTPGQVVVLDNLSSHLSPRVDALIESCGARVMRLPPYSPDFNPIERAISKIKSVVRKRGARTTISLYYAIAEALNAVTPGDATAFIQTHYANATMR
jgi:transposase